jgi:6-phosphofructokinase
MTSTITSGYLCSRFVHRLHGANLDNRPAGVYIAVVMGRHAGFLTAASSLGRATDDRISFT